MVAEGAVWAAMGAAERAEVRTGWLHRRDAAALAEGGQRRAEVQAQLAVERRAGKGGSAERERAEQNPVRKAWWLFSQWVWSEWGGAGWGVEDELECHEWLCDTVAYWDGDYELVWARTNLCVVGVEVVLRVWEAAAARSPAEQLARMDWLLLERWEGERGWGSMGGKNGWWVRLAAAVWLGSAAQEVATVWGEGVSEWVEEVVEFVREAGVPRRTWQEQARRDGKKDATAERQRQQQQEHHKQQQARERVEWESRRKADAARKQAKQAAAAAAAAAAHAHRARPGTTQVEVSRRCTAHRLLLGRIALPPPPVSRAVARCGDSGGSSVASGHDSDREELPGPGRVHGRHDAAAADAAAAVAAVAEVLAAVAAAAAARQRRAACHAGGRARRAGGGGRCRRDRRHQRRLVRQRDGGQRRVRRSLPVTTAVWAGFLVSSLARAGQYRGVPPE